MRLIVDQENSNILLDLTPEELKIVVLLGRGEFDDLESYIKAYISNRLNSFRERQRALITQKIRAADETKLANVLNILDAAP